MKITRYLNNSALLTVVGIIFFFSFAVVITLFAPSYVDPSWRTPSSHYQVQMYEVADPNIYISAPDPSGSIQHVYNLQAGFTLLAFQESDTQRITTTPELEPYITKSGQPLILTSRLLLLRPTDAPDLQKQLQDKWRAAHPNDPFVPRATILELYDPQLDQAFAVAESDGVSENWIDENFTIVDPSHSYHHHPGVLYVSNPLEYRVRPVRRGQVTGWEYTPSGRRIHDLTELQSSGLGFLSRQELIRLGEHIYAIEGCWYCHTDQSRTLVEDSVLNGSDNYPAPPSSANEYIYQNITFPGTRRIGPDLARVGVKRPTRDWHASHFWSPKTESPGSIMPAFRQFFDNDPRGTPQSPYGVPNYRFEAIFQYLMTKGTRITPPTQAWWLGKDPVQTAKLIEKDD